jgi:diadenosine tetraphosphate (Ap4A) HIT family hydrolase
MAFTLHPQLQADTVPIGDLALCRVLLMNDTRFPWLILVPQRGGAREWFDLMAGERAQLGEEIALVAERLKAHISADKINVAALGNQVPQLHIHIIARFTSDCAWPQPVWSAKAARESYTPDEIAALVARFQRLLVD